MMNTNLMAYNSTPDKILMNGKSAYSAPPTESHESFTVEKGTNKDKYNSILSVLLNIVLHLSFYICRQDIQN